MTLFVVPLTLWAIIPALIFFWLAVNLDGERRIIVGLRRFYEYDIDAALSFLSAGAAYFGRVVWLAEDQARPDVLYDARAKSRAALMKSFKALLLGNAVVFVALVVVRGLGPATFLLAALIFMSSYIQLVAWARGHLAGLLALLGTVIAVTATLQLFAVLTWLADVVLAIEYLVVFSILYSLFYAVGRLGALEGKGISARIAGWMDRRIALSSEEDIQRLELELGPRSVIDAAVIRNSPAVVHEFQVIDRLWRHAFKSMIGHAHIVLFDMTRFDEISELSWELQHCAARKVPVVFTVSTLEADRARRVLAEHGFGDDTSLFEWIPPHVVGGRQWSSPNADVRAQYLEHLASLFEVPKKRIASRP